MHIVVVDDNPSVLSILKILCEQRGHTVLAYESPLHCPPYGASVCPCGIGRCPDAIISDCSMPHVSGMKFLEHIRQRGCRCPHFAIITGKGLDSVELVRVAKLGARFFLKPVDLLQVFDWLARLELKGGAPRP